MKKILCRMLSFCTPRGRRGGLLGGRRRRAARVIHGGERAELEGLADAAAAAAATVVVVGGGGLDVVDGLDLTADGKALLLAHRGATGPGHGQRSRGVIPEREKAEFDIKI